MGAKCLFRIQINEYYNSAQVHKELQRRVEAHTGRRVGPWQVSAQQYGSKGNVRPPVVVFTTSEEPEKRYFLTGKHAIETDDGLSALLSKIPALTPTQSFMVKGIEYDLVDFTVRVGMVFEKSGPTSNVVEIGYLPCSIVDNCVGLITELMDKIAAPLVAPQDSRQDSQANAAAETNYEFRLVPDDFQKVEGLANTPFSMRHTAMLYSAMLYLNLFNKR
uniref:Mediator of RNA polymerase II transcription subunit 20 n=1 Tax=Rhodosorus marinus TaxID=101924 RepID=A0A7S3A9S3_9RHOD|mmetsp:Transcript_8369/g.37425  ORF Transcript_8369/g.37425 Transcript_8369/m.37425 type:complete len:219 (+) Transcript_8369:125-781(+)